MATVKIDSITQQTFFNAETQAMDLVAWLRVQWRDDEGQSGVNILNFGDYAGLEAEWTEGQGTVTTVLNAAIDTDLAASAPTVDDSTSTEIATERTTYNYSP